MIIRLVRIFSTNEERTKMKRERERKGGDDISIRWRYEAVVDGDFGTVLVVVWSRAFGPDKEAKEKPTTQLLPR